MSTHNTTQLKFGHLKQLEHYKPPPHIHPQSHTKLMKQQVNKENIMKLQA
jgi:hypothetical protein